MFALPGLQRASGSPFGHHLPAQFLLLRQLHSHRHFGHATSRLLGHPAGGNVCSDMPFLPVTWSDPNSLCKCVSNSALLPPWWAFLKGQLLLPLFCSLWWICCTWPNSWNICGMFVCVRLCPCSLPRCSTTAAAGGKPVTHYSFSLLWFSLSLDWWYFPASKAYSHMILEVGYCQKHFILSLTIPITQLLTELFTPLWCSPWSHLNLLPDTTFSTSCWWCCRLFISSGPAWSCAWSISSWEAR